MGVTQSFLYQVRRMSLWDSVNRLESRTGVTNPSESPRDMIGAYGSVRGREVSSLARWPPFRSSLA